MTDRLREAPREIWAVKLGGDWWLCKKSRAREYGMKGDGEVWSEVGTTAFRGFLDEEDVRVPIHALLADRDAAYARGYHDCQQNGITEGRLIIEDSPELAMLRDALRAKLAVAVKTATEALNNIDDLNTLPRDENGHCWRKSDLIDQEVMHARAALAQLTEDTTDPRIEGWKADETKEYIVDTIEEIIGETHDIDARDRHYAENIVSWLERHHPEAIRAIPCPYVKENDDV